MCGGALLRMHSNGLRILVVSIEGGQQIASSLPIDNSRSQASLVCLTPAEMTEKLVDRGGAVFAITGTSCRVGSRAS